QRNFAADIISGKVYGTHPGKAALIAFYGDDPDDWRLSFVKVDTELVCNEKKVCITKTLSPARRSSFLVGLHEPSHTCMKRFCPLIQETKEQPTLSQLEEIFHVEAVTSLFFNEYLACYTELTASLQKIMDSDIVVHDEFEKRNIDAAEFSKKLMGQIVFLYFLQKKGWLGVEVGEKWGTGPKDFMKQLFEKKIVPYENFFDDILEPLFYEALAKRNDSDYYSRFGLRIPFLNGGLFEPMKGYDWVKTNIRLENKIFERIILDTFERYNFTIKEDEPLEREVAVDPEMLGKVFESLLNITERKSKGAYYTPRFIVHYICQQSLISYLSKHAPVPLADIETLIQKGDEFYASTLQQTKYSFNTDNKDTNLQTLPQSISEDAPELDALLKNIKVADPAVGSGAFPVGMMNEIVKARNALTVCLKQGQFTEERKTYTLKRDAIENCLYGVDLDSSAVEITKLRFWLSLIVDEENTDKIQPLPNLDQKIMSGNSLLETFEGIQLFDPDLLSEDLDSLEEQLQEIDSDIARHKDMLDLISWNTESEKVKRITAEIEELRNKKSKLLSDKPIKEINQSLDAKITSSFKHSRVGLKKYRLLQRKFFNELDKFKKENLRNEMHNLEWDIIETEAEHSGNSRIVAKLKDMRDKSTRPFFLWKLYFSEVFGRENPGFDCVIGNPPYIQLQSMDEEDKKSYRDIGYSTYAATGDIYCLFYEMGHRLLRNDGTLGFITSNKWMRAGYGDKLRGFLTKNTNPMILIDFAGQKVFEEATVDVNVLIFSKSPNIKETICCIVKKDCLENMSEYIEQTGYACDFTGDGSWAILSPIEQQIKDKIERVGTPLKNWNLHIYRGVLTGYNEAFIIDGKKKDELIAQDPKSAEIIRPILRGRDVKRYGYTNHDLWLLFIPWHFPLHNDSSINGSSILAEKEFQKQYPAIYNHLLKYKSELSARNKSETGIRYEWYALQRWGAKYWEDFSKQKIIYPNMTKYLPFYYDEENYMTNQKCFIITGEHLSYLTAFFNSSLFKYCFRDNFPELQGGTRELSKIFFEKISVLKVNNQINDEFRRLVLNIQKFKSAGKDTVILEKEIDKKIYEIYNLSDEEQKEIGFVEIK
ncbi:MAG: Eco57I restriction-modification methylase domain-containing protein, partial [Bacteroidales bacterium]|nr:Eco57I restriction-modification methylase domain-containing protein [Bacteroidales bacterium]